MLSSDRVELSVMLDLCKQVNSAFSLKISLLIRSNCLQLSDLDIDPSLYLDPLLFKSDYLISCYLSKWKGWENGIDLHRVAIDSWKADERKNAETNLYLKNLRSVNLTDDDGNSLIMAVSRKISQILGPFNLSAVLSGCKWGPGATYDLRRGTTLDNKISNKMSVTRQALPFIRVLIENDPNWVEAITGFYPCGPVSLLPSSFLKTECNRVLTVPKSSKTHRTIAAEPTANSYLQQGVGRFIRRRLRLCGVDLDDQTRNQKLAAMAYNHGLCTIDLKSASNTICRELVLDVLSVDWAFFLDAIRSKYSKVEGTEMYLQMFSSMGNAFTFELETLIFYAVSCVALDKLGLDHFGLGVYGDDIVIDARAYPLMQVFLEKLGFTINVRKSFASGNFFESCGKHYFCGVDVSPVYQKEIVSSHPSEIIRAFNRLYKYDLHLTRRARRLYQQCWSHHTCPRIPDVCSDDRGFLTKPELLGPYDRNRGFYCHVYVYVPKLKAGIGPSLLSEKLRRPQFSSSDRKGRGQLTDVRGSYRFSMSWIHGWNEMAVK